MRVPGSSAAMAKRNYFRVRVRVRVRVDVRVWLCGCAVKRAEQRGQVKTLQQQRGRPVDRRDERVRQPGDAVGHDRQHVLHRVHLPQRPGVEGAERAMNSTPRAAPK